MIIAANWKMNPPLADAGQLVSAYTQTNFDGVQRVLFPPHPYLVHMAMRLEGSGILLEGRTVIRLLREPLRGRGCRDAQGVWGINGPARSF